MSVNVFCILGLGHSGTTLLGRLLGAHSEIVATGGLRNVTRFQRGERDCSCGAGTPGDCPFWTRVDEALGQRGQALRELDFDHPYHRLDAGQVRAYYEAVLQAANARGLVDTSRRRSDFEALDRVAGVNLIPVHIFKDPRAQVASGKRKGQPMLASMWNYKTRGRRVRGLDDATGRVVHVAYERLCRDPHGQIARILKPAGLAVEPGQIENFGKNELHLIGGNRMRADRSSTIRLDESWRERLSGPQQWLVRAFNGRDHQRNLERADP